jgi:hypothetical protein
MAGALEDGVAVLSRDETAHAYDPERIDRRPGAGFRGALLCGTRF